MDRIASIIIANAKLTNLDAVAGNRTRNGNDAVAVAAVAADAAVAVGSVDGGRGASPKFLNWRQEGLGEK
jgi:hypothetical protein